MKNRHKYALILLILIVLSIGFGLLAMKKSKSFNKTEATVKSSGHSTSQKDQTSASGNQGNTAPSTKTITCPDCDGSGNVVCPECEGRGLYYICGECQGKFFTYLNTCPSCGSRNSFIQHTCSPTITCPRCGGSGQIPA